MHNTPIFTWKPNLGLNHKMIFYISIISFKEAPTSNSLAPTGRKLWPPIFSCYNLREDLTPQFSGYNQKEATTPYFIWIQPHILTSYKHPKI
jgi:hypothetical protein